MTDSYIMYRKKVFHNVEICKLFRNHRNQKASSFPEVSSIIIIITIYNNNNISIIIDNTIKKPKSTEVHKVKISIDFHENKCF